jgi:putative FmdB family regulatory protein
MPVYVYRCDECEESFEVTHSIHADPLATHDGCGATVRRLIQNPAVHFQGGRTFFRDTTIKSELEKTMQGVRDSGGNPEPVGTRWV